jgi:hypothetical protein
VNSFLELVRKSIGYGPIDACERKIDKIQKMDKNDNIHLKIFYGSNFSL